MARIKSDTGNGGPGRPAQRRLPRHALESSLSRMRSGTVVTVVAGAGYGKTALLEQWARRSEVRAVSLTVEEGDAAPQRLGRRLLAALTRVLPSDDPTAPAASDPAVTVDGLVERLRDTPLWLAFDDAHLLAGDGLALAAGLANARLPQLTLVLAGRSLPTGLNLPRLAVQGRVTAIPIRRLDIDGHDLALSLPPAVRPRAVRLHEQTGGWPAAIHALLQQLETGDNTPLASSLSSYLDGDVLAELPPSAIAYLEDLAITGLETISDLDELRGEPLGNSVAALLRDRPAPLIDVEEGTIALRPLMAEHLLARVRRTDPARIGAMGQRLGAHLVAQGRPEDAFAYVRTRSDRAGLAEFMHNQGLMLALQGNHTLVRQWMDQFEVKDLYRFPKLIVLHAALAMMAGDFSGLQSWLVVLKTLEHEGAAPWSPGDPSMRHLLSELAGLTPPGPGLAAALKAPPPYLLIGFALEAFADLARGDFGSPQGSGAAMLELTRGMPVVGAWLAASLAMSDALAGRWAQGRATLDQIPGSWSAALVQASRLTFLLDAVMARYAAEEGDHAGARFLMSKAHPRLEELTVGFPMVRLAAYLMLAQTAVRLREPMLVKVFHAQGRALAASSPALAKLLDETAEADSTAPRLTDAQMRVLERLNGPLTVPRIAAELHLSPATVRTHIRHIYLRLDVTNRADAAARAKELGLI